MATPVGVTEPAGSPGGADVNRRRVEQQPKQPLEVACVGGTKLAHGKKQGIRTGRERALGELVTGRLEPHKSTTPVRSVGLTARVARSLQLVDHAHRPRVRDPQRPRQHVHRPAVGPFVKGHQCRRQRAGQTRRGLGRIPDRVAERQSQSAETVGDWRDMCFGHIVSIRMIRTAQPSHGPRLTRWELVGAWLRIWTPPKDLDVPPVPWRRLAIGGAAAAIAIGAIAAVAVPRIDSGKRAGALERARAQAAADAAERSRLRLDQKVHRLAIPAGVPIVAGLEKAITVDAKARVRAGTLSGPVLSTSCAKAGSSTRQFADSQVYKCFVKTATGLRGEGTDVLDTGYPFVATAYEAQRRVAWCKQNPHADEKGSHGDVRVKLSPVCAGRLTAVL